MILKETYYRPQDEALRQIAAIQTLAKWRHEERGPKWYKSGRNVLYKGAELLEWLEQNSVQPELA